MADRVFVKDSDMISAKSLLTLLSDSISGMKKSLESGKGQGGADLTEIQKAAGAGAVEALTDLHNLVLNQINDARTTEVFEDDGGDRGGKFDA